MRVRPEFFVFCEKRTGAARFQVPAGKDGSLPTDQAAGLLAMHCLVRGRVPSDYMVMVAASDGLLDGVASRAERLLEASQAIACPVRLSRREEEVLGGVLQNLANKEIAAKLGLSERTVKFHVSSLLAKFRVQGRVGLMREAAGALLPWGSFGAASAGRFPEFMTEALSPEAQGREVPRRIAFEAPTGSLTAAPPRLRNELPPSKHVLRLPRRRLSA